MSARITSFRQIDKPWGKEIVIEHNERYAFKEIYMKKGTRSSLQSHERKIETLFIAEGKIELETVSSAGKQTTEIYSAREAYSIQPGTKHRVTVLEDCRLFEVSTPELDDVIRHQDDFGRS